MRFERTDLCQQVNGFADRRDRPLRHAPGFSSQGRKKLRTNSVVDLSKLLC